MNNPSAVVQSLIIYAILVPLALLLGYMLAEPLSYSSIFLVLGLIGLMLLPLFIKWHHFLSIACWNLTMVAFFMPGRLKMGLVIAIASLGVSIVTRTLQNRGTSVSCRWVSYPLIALAIITLATMRARGGFHARVFGSDDWGAGRYFSIFAAIAGYFALVAQPVSPGRAKLLVSLFFLSGGSAVITTLIQMCGGDFQILYLFFPMTATIYEGTQTGVQRFADMGQAALAVCYFMMARHGIRGVFDWTRPWRWLSFIGIFSAGLLGGFRTNVVSFGLLFLFQLYFEKLFRTRLFFVLLMAGALAGAVLIPTAKLLPLPVQRSISFLPIDVDQVARQDAEVTAEWRLEMWQVALPEVPRYLFHGKGYDFSSTDLYLTMTAMQYGLYGGGYEGTLISSDYHSGPLTLIIPLGIYGLIAFLAFCWGSVRVLHANYLNGDPELKLANTFLLAFFMMRLVFFVVFYGAFYLDLFVFTGMVGLSLTLNGGVRVRKPVEASQTTASVVRLPGFKTA